MNTRDDARNMKKLFSTAAALLKDAGRSMAKESATPLRYALLGKCMDGADQRFKEIHANANSSVFVGLGSGAALIGQALDQLDSLPSDHDGSLCLYDLIGGLEVTADALRDAANSISLPGPLDDSIAQRARNTLDQFAGFQLDTALIAQRFHTTASVLREVVRLPLRDDFAFPGPGGCGCATTLAGDDGAAPDELSGDSTSRSLIDPRKETALALADVDTLANDLGTFMVRSAAFLSEFPVVLFALCCGNLCPTPNVATGCTLARVYANNNGTSFTPMFDLNWTVCCPCSCCLVFTQNRVTTVTSTHGLTGVAVIPNTRPIGAAIRVATPVATAAATAANGALTATPPLPVPAQPPGVAFGVAGGLAVPGCVKC